MLIQDAGVADVFNKMLSSEIENSLILNNIMHGLPKPSCKRNYSSTTLSIYKKDEKQILT